ncbi:MAG: hypothetical protein AAF441_19095 [Pseudomonadota bacterium]
MANFNTRIHIVGEPENGIVITTFNPFKVFTIGWESIRSYNDRRPGPPDVIHTYRDLCKALVGLVLDLSDGQTTALGDAHAPALDDLFTKGVRVNNSDLSLSAFIDVELHDQSMNHMPAPRRKGYQMLHNLIDAIRAEDTPIPHEIEPFDDEDYPGGDGHGGHHHHH